MRLRSRFLVLIALLVSAALAASFWVITAAVQGQTLTDLDRSLKVAQSVWRTVSQSQAQTLVSTATGMAGEAGFVTVLRGTDPATLLDYLRDTQKNNPALDMILVCDDQGKMRVRTDPSEQPISPEDPLLVASLEGQVGAAFWQCDSGFYLAAAAPIYRRGDVIEGVLLIGTRLDQRFVDKLSQDTATQVALLPDHGAGFTTMAGLNAQSIPGLHSVTTPLTDFRGLALGNLVMARDVNSALSYTQAVRWQLLWLGVGAVALAFIISVPLVGRMTNPVLLLEKAQAEMDAVFQANRDGVIALDQAGRIVTANPAAAVCLGQPLEGLAGRSLEQLLPPDVFSQLIAVPPSSGQLVQRCEWQREGRLFQLTRTFVASQHVEVGSVLVTRDCSQENLPWQDQQKFLKRLTATLRACPRDPGAWLDWEKNRENLLLLAGAAPTDESPVHDLGGEMSALVNELQPSGCGQLQLGADLPRVDLSRGQLRLLLLNLLLSDPPGIRLYREGGGCWLVVEGVAPLADWEQDSIKRLLKPVEGRLEQDTTSARVWLPASLC